MVSLAYIALINATESHFTTLPLLCSRHNHLPNLLKERRRGIMRERLTLCSPYDFFLSKKITPCKPLILLGLRGVIFDLISVTFPFLYAF
nr:MAG TPA: hypothetical protein [Caudoviricetes sp.]